MVSCCRSWKCSFMRFSTAANFLRFERSETTKMKKKVTVKTVPAMVAISLVNRFTMAVESRTRCTLSSPSGISTPRTLIFGGTFQPRSPLYFQRKTSMERLLKVKLQITPKA